MSNVVFFTHQYQSTSSNYFREVIVSNMSSIKRGCAALATIFCVTACASVGLAQTTYYNWQGGSGTWNASGGTAWTTGASFGAFSTQDQPWVNDATSAGSTSIAAFGYVETSGSGSANKYQIYDFASSYFTTVNLDPNNVINANSLFFGNVANGFSQYGLTGGSLNLTANGTGTSPNIEIDLATYPISAASDNFEISIASNLTVGGGTGTLSFCTANGGTTTVHGDNSVGNVFLSGANQFGSVIIGGIGPNESVAGSANNYSALVFMNTQSLNFNGHVPNITIGNLGELCYMGSNYSSTVNTSGTIGTVTLQPGIGVNTTPGGTSLPTVDHVPTGYTPNTGQYAFGTQGVGMLARIGGKH